MKDLKAKEECRKGETNEKCFALDQTRCLRNCTCKTKIDLTKSPKKTINC